MKRIISLLLALVIAISAAIPAYATGDGNMDSGGSGMGDGTKTNYWNPGMDGVRLSVVHADNRANSSSTPLAGVGRCGSCCP